VPVDVGAMSAFSSATPQWTPRHFLSVSKANKRSTQLSQEELVGTRWTCQQGRLASRSRTKRILWAAYLSKSGERLSLGDLASIWSRYLRTSAVR